MPIARSVAPRSNAPASDVTSPASNAASTARPSTTPKSNRSALHSVGIGAFFESLRSRSRKTTFADSQPRCAYLCEKCGLGPTAARPLGKKLAREPGCFGCAATPYGCINEVGLNLTWGDGLEGASGRSGVWGRGYSGHTWWLAVGVRRRRLLLRKVVF